jgi:hypothetical protein
MARNWTERGRMRTRILACGLMALCLLSGCDGHRSSQGTATSAAQSDLYYDGFYRDPARDAGVLPEGARELNLEDALEELECLGAISRTCSRDEFYALSEIIIREGNSKVFSELLDNDSLTVRAMGLLCSAKTERSGAVDILKAHLRDRGAFDFEYYCTLEPDYADYEWPEDRQGDGMTGYEAYLDTIGNFARRLLKDADGSFYGPSPLLSPGDMLRLDLEILADDTATAFHHEAIYSIVWANEEGKVGLDTETLQRLSVEPFYQTVKAVGRIGCQYAGTPDCVTGELFPKRKQLTQQVRQFLIQQLNDSELDANSRLAAASALTRGSLSEIVQALRWNEGILNGMSDQALGTRFLATVEKREKYDACLADLQRQDWRYRRREMYAQIQKMCECRDELEHDIASYEGPWDTYRSLPLD